MATATGAPVGTHLQRLFHRHLVAARACARGTRPPARSTPAPHEALDRHRHAIDASPRRPREREGPRRSGASCSGDKPDSVLEQPSISRAAYPRLGGQRHRPCRRCTGWGLPGRRVTTPPVRSHRIISTLPATARRGESLRRCSFCCTLPSVFPLGVTQHPALRCPDFPRGRRLSPSSAAAEAAPRSSVGPRRCAGLDQRLGAGRSVGPADQASLPDGVRGDPRGGSGRRRFRRGRPGRRRRAALGRGRQRGSDRGARLESEPAGLGHDSARGAARRVGWSGGGGAYETLLHTPTPTAQVAARHGSGSGRCASFSGWRRTWSALP